MGPGGVGRNDGQRYLSVNARANLAQNKVSENSPFQREQDREISPAGGSQQYDHQQQGTAEYERRFAEFDAF